MLNRHDQKVERFIKTNVNDVNEKHFVPIKKACDAILKGKIILQGGKKIEANLGALHALYRAYCTNAVEEKVCEIIADSIIFYEKKFPTSGMVLVAMLAGTFVCDQHKPKRISFNDAKSTALAVINNEVATNLFLEILDVTGADSKISVIRQPVEKPIIKPKTKPRARIQIPENFFNIDFRLPQEISDVYFFMINGAAAKITELEFLFNESAESNSYYIIVSKSFSEEILNVLKLNFGAGKLKIIPAVFGFDIDSINSLADLVSIVGGLPISSDLGDLISGDHKNRYGYSEKVILNRSSFEFYGNNFGNTDGQILNLKNKIQNVDSQDKRELLTKRLSNITGNSCEVILPRTELFETVAKELDVAFSVLKFCCAYLCNEASISEEVGNVYFPAVSIEVATDRFAEICRIIEDTNRAVIKADVS